MAIKTLRKIQEENKNLILDALKDSGIPFKTREIFTLEKILLTLRDNCLDWCCVYTTGYMYSLIQDCGVNETCRIGSWDFLALDDNGFNTLEAQNEDFQRKFNKMLNA